MELTPGATSLDEIEAVWRGGAVRLSPGARGAVEASRARVEAAARGAEGVYGVNTGFGKLAHVRIGAESVEALQRNLILSHCAGVGAPLSPALTRLMMALKLLSLGRGASGVRWAVPSLIEAMLERDVVPVVPHQGSVGASGDLAPLAHMTAVLIGEGEAWVDGRRMPGGEALRGAGLEPVVLGAKEGLALINGTQFSTACALGALFEARRILLAHVVTGAMATDAVMGSTAPLRPEIHALRGQPGQIAVAAMMRAALEGSEIRESHRIDDARVQDPYCIRCAPQVVGACLDALRAAEATLEIEANAATDNPLVLEDAIVSGGNFHAEPVGFAADGIALALAELGSIAQRRVATMVDPALSHGLPAFLTPDPGLHSGLMIAEVTSAALMAENRHLAHPCVIDSTPTSANQEDHVSMAAHGAFRLMRMVENLAGIVGIEAMAAAQGIEARAPLLTSGPLRAAVERLRRDVPPLGPDRVLTGDIEAAARLVRSGELAEAAGVDA